MLGGVTSELLGGEFVDGMVGPVLAECMAELIQDGAEDRAIEAALDKAESEGRSPQPEDFYKAMQEEVDVAVQMGKVTALTGGLLLDHDLDMVSTTTNNALENNFVLHAGLLALSVGTAAWTAYEVYDAYQTGGPEAALHELAVTGAVIIATGVGGKILYKVGTLTTPIAKDAFKAVLKDNSTLKLMVTKFGSGIERSRGKRLNQKIVKLLFIKTHWITLVKPTSM